MEEMKRVHQNISDLAPTLAIRCVMGKVASIVPIPIDERIIDFSLVE